MKQNEVVNISLELLLLNDLLRIGAIDRDTYDKAERTIYEQNKVTTAA